MMRNIQHWLTELRQFGRIWRAYFHRLQWKLTLAYTLFTLATTIVLSGVALILIWYINFQSSLYPDDMAKFLREGSTVAASYLDQSPPDVDGLEAWLRSIVQDNYLIMTFKEPFPRQERQVSAPDNLGYIDYLVVTDAQGDTLWSLHEPPPTLREPLAGVLQAALQAETDSTRLTFRDSDNLVIAAPLLGQAEQPVGALIFVTDNFPIGQADFISRVFSRLILPFSGAMLLVGVLVGLPFGYVIARGLTRRIQALDDVTDAWSQGNFDVLAQDNSGDELGHLARHMNEMALQLQTLLQTRQEFATLEERNRLARDLHDSVKQQVFATAMQVGAARALLEQKPRQAKTHLSEAEQLVRQAQQELTALILQLRPAALAGQGLANALREYVTDWSRQTTIQAEVRVRGERPLPLTIEQTLLRVAQEALANVARHSCARQVEVDLAWEADCISLTVRDDGQGFNPMTKHGQSGVGLHSMRERVEALGGCLDIKSQPSRGTTIIAKVKEVDSRR